MATNIVAYIKDTGKNIVEVHWLGAAALGASDDGYWLDVSALDEKVLHVSGVSGDTIQVFGSNKATNPGNSNDEVQVGSNITGDSLVEVTFPIRWMKVKMTFSAGSVYAIMNARRKR